MSEQQASTESQSQAQNTAQPPAASASSQNDTAPAWLPERLKQAKESAERAILEQLGVQNVDDLKSRLTKARELEQQQMTESEKAAARIKELESSLPKLQQAESTLKSMIEDQFESLSDAQKAAIDAVANGDAMSRWQLMQVVRAASAGQETQPAPPKPPAQTVPAGTPRPPAAPAPAQTKFEMWQDRSKRNPIEASIFYNANMAEIERTRPTA